MEKPVIFPTPDAAASTSDSLQHDDPWRALRRFTNARIALGRTGDSLPTRPLLAFNLSHAQARDAVHQTLDTSALAADLSQAGHRTIQVCSAAPDREHYLRRPDMGRRLSDASVQALRDLHRHDDGARSPAAKNSRNYIDTPNTADSGDAHDGPDIVFVIGDGLSAYAGARHAVPFLQAICARLNDWKIGPVVIATQARVALADGVGEILGAKIVVMLIGERPGLSSPDSLGIYLTYAPHIGVSDADRNCISNVRPEGLSYDVAAFKLAYLLNEARRLGLTGVSLKDDSDHLLAAMTEQPTDTESLTNAKRAVRASPP